MSFELELIRDNIGFTKNEMRNRICEFEKFLGSFDEAIYGKVEGNIECPVRHAFVEGAYIREITMPKGLLLTSKIHKIRHPYFVLSGDCLVITDDKSVRIKAPYWGVTEPLTKRILYIYEETVWITVHVTDKTDLYEIEKEIILPNFDNILENKEQ